MARIPDALSALAHYFPRRASTQLRELYLTFGILDLAISAVVLFEPIYLFKLGYGISAIVAFYLAIYACYFCILPFGAKVALRYGYAKSIFISSFFFIAYYISLMGLKWTPFSLVTAVPALALQKMLYWPGFHAEFARFGDDREEAREVSAREVIDIVVSVAGPLFGGLILYLSNFVTLFVVVCLLIVLSNVPILTVPEQFAPGTFSYRDAYRRLFQPEYRRMALSFFGYGEEFIVLILWPLYMYAYIGNLLSLGSLVAATTLLTATLVLYIGRMADHADKRDVLRLSAIGYATVWLLRLTVQSIGGVFSVDALSRLMKRLLEVPQLSLLYQHARHEHHIMRNAVLFEMSLVIGKIATMCLAILIFAAWPTLFWPLMFTLAAFLTLFYTLF